MIIIYTQDDCLQCHFAKRYLQERHIEFKEVNISKDLKAKKMLIKDGWRRTPVMVVNNQWFSGFQPHRLKKLEQQPKPRPRELAR
ncbi:glutaredoxin family protein [Limosilactobacillus fermentum]|uniref:glutaredoxin family protein n=1 Tax=Limosilactobacillus fermentum TaxID=1613 RepID=UPI002AC98695|nr:glutaredoxin family protein [Limosilactobacillus fermentum]